MNNKFFQNNISGHKTSFFDKNLWGLSRAKDKFMNNIIFLYQIIVDAQTHGLSIILTLNTDRSVESLKEKQLPLD